MVLHVYTVNIDLVTLDKSFQSEKKRHCPLLDITYIYIYIYVCVCVCVCVCLFVCVCVLYLCEPVHVSVAMSKKEQCLFFSGW